MITIPPTLSDTPVQHTNLLQTMLDGAINGILLLEPICDAGQTITDFRILAANRAVKEMTGVEPSTAVGQTMQAVYPGYKTGGFFQVYCDVMADGQARRTEHYYEDPTLKGWFEVSVVKQGAGLVLTFTNITIAKEASLLVKQATDHLQNVIDFSQTGICVCSPVLDAGGELIDFHYKAINRMVATLVGQTPDTMRGTMLSEWFPNYQQTAAFDNYKKTYETNEPQRFEINYVIDGFDRWFDVQCSRQADDVLVTFTDFTPLKQAQQVVEWQSGKNREQANLLNSILDSSDSGIMAFEAIRNPKNHEQIIDFRFLMANQACVNIVGKPTNQLIGRPLLRVFPGNKESGLFDAYKRTTETGEPFRTETYYNYDGLDFWLSISAQKMGDGFVVTFNDVSGFRLLQQQLENLVADLKRSNENLQQFAYVASHDLQEPLRKMQAFGDMLKTTYAGPLGDGADLVNRMQVAAGRMSSLIRDLLTYSRLSTNNDTMKPVNLTDVMNQVTDDLDLMIAETGSQISCEELPTVPGDSFQLQQLFQNLLSNALKFRRLDIGPAIRITTQAIAFEDLPDDVKPLRRVPSYRAISVSDNGIGFDERYRERIFQVFQRLHGKQQYAGTGIGLAIVQKVADNHGGAVSASSHSGEGATFTVYLPG